jgi:hypothetical protein
MSRRGRPLKYPLIEGESKQDRQLRLKRKWREESSEEAKAEEISSRRRGIRYMAHEINVPNCKADHQICHVEYLYRFLQLPQTAAFDASVGFNDTQVARGQDALKG